MNFEKLKAEIDRWIDGGLPEAQIIVMKNHEELFRYAAGTRDKERKVPADFDSLRWLYSMTKPVTMTAAMRLSEQGKLNFDDPVEKYIPSFKDHMIKREDGGTVPSKTVLTVRHLMTMTGGYTYSSANYPLMFAKRKVPGAGTMDIISEMGKDPAYAEPGAKYNYSFCHDIVAAVIEAASGMKFGEYLKKEIFVPLGMDGTGFIPDEETFKNFSEQYYVQGDQKTFDLHGLGNVFRLSPDYESGGAGLYSRARDYIKLADALASGGVAANGYRVLKEESIKEMSRDQLSPALSEQFSKQHTWFADYSYGLGVRTRVRQGESRVPPGEFGWDGAAGSYVLIDPENAVSIVYTEFVLNHYNIYRDGHPAFRELAYESMGIERR